MSGAPLMALSTLKLGEFAQASGPHLLAGLASPAEWQRLLIGAGAVLRGFGTFAEKAGKLTFRQARRGPK